MRITRRPPITVMFFSLLSLIASTGFSQQVMSIEDGMVGIGTEMPEALLHVSATSAANFRFSSPNLGYLLEDTDAANDKRILQFLMNGGKFRIRGLSSDFMQNVPGITLRLGDSGGDVGIGTSDPLSRLHVSGGDIRVSGGSFIADGTILDVPDYVFATSYSLRPLSEVADFISREKHLPGVPPAATIQESGLNIPHFQMKLLEKIEELTLYTLAQEEKIAQMELLLEEVKRQLSDRTATTQ